MVCELAHGANKASFSWHPYPTSHGFVQQIEQPPYYSSGISNVASRRIAISVGYQPAWVEMYSRGRAEVYSRELNSY